jgi:hypothetical protein
MEVVLKNNLLKVNGEHAGSIRIEKALFGNSFKWSKMKYKFSNHHLALFIAIQNSLAQGPS